MSEPVVAADVAKQEFDRWIAAMGLVAKCDTSTMDEEDAKSFESGKRVLLEAMKAGGLVVDQNGELDFTPALGDKSTIHFAEPTGAVILAMDKAKKDANVAKQFAMLAMLTGQNAPRFVAMKQRDLQVCNAVIGFLLGK